MGAWLARLITWRLSRGRRPRTIGPAACRAEETQKKCGVAARWKYGGAGHSSRCRERLEARRRRRPVGGGGGEGRLRGWPPRGGQRCALFPKKRTREAARGRRKEKEEVVVVEGEGSGQAPDLRAALGLRSWASRVQRERTLGKSEAHCRGAQQSPKTWGGAAEGSGKASRGGREQTGAASTAALLIRARRRARAKKKKDTGRAKDRRQEKKGKT